MIQIIISVIILVYAIINFKKGLIAFLAFQIVWFKDQQIITIPGLASINIDLIMDFAFLLLFITKRKKIKLSKVDFPLKTPFITLGCSWILTSFSFKTSFFGEFVRAAGNITIQLLFVVMIWYVLDNHKDFITIFKYVTLIVFVANIYSLIEYALKYNPILDYKLSLTSTELETYNTNEYAVSYRGYRSSSIFEHTIAAAMVYGFYLVFTLIIINSFREKIKLEKFSIITCFLCIPGILLTKMRTGIFFVIIGVFFELIFAPKKISKRNLYNFLLIGFFGLIFIIPVISENISLILSIFSKDAQSAVGGSNISWRITQAKYIFDYGKQTLFLGCGENFRKNADLILLRKYTGDFESLWFEQFLAHGLFGVTAYVILIYYLTFKLSKKYDSIHLLGFSLSYWITYSMTSLPYFRTFLYFLIVFYFIKKTDLYKSMNR